MNNKDSLKKIELMLIDLSYKFKSLENTFSFIKGHKNSILLILAGVLISVGVSLFKDSIIKDIQQIHNVTIKEVQQMHNVTVPKIRYSINKNRKD
jgi:hypothetical protein